MATKSPGPPLIPTGRTAAWTAAAILAVMAGFLFYWAAGGTWEPSGASQAASSVADQIVAAINGLLVLAFAGVLLARVGYWREHVPFKVARVGAWVVACALFAGALEGFATQTGGPVELAAALLAYRVARSEPPVSPARGAQPTPTGSPGPPTPVH